MALFKLRCQGCSKPKSVIADNFDSIPTERFRCGKCGETMKRETLGPSTSILERLDNGSMVRALERYSDAEQIFQERHDKADPLAGTKPNKS